MNAIRNWRGVRDEVRRRVARREWAPGESIPNEADLAREFGCARATVNRALRELAQSGLLDRRRRAGTRVALDPVRRAVLEIPVIAREIESRGRRHGYALQAQRREGASLYVLALHLADGAPYVIEDRRISLDACPTAAGADFASVSANEWLLRHAAYSHGEIAFLAAAAEAEEARLLGTPPGAALFVVERVTWNGEAEITSVRLSYAPAYRMRARL